MRGGTAERAHARAHNPLSTSPNPQRVFPHQGEWLDLKKKQKKIINKTTSVIVIIISSNLFKMRVNCNAQ